MAKQFILNLKREDWDQLEKVAKENGFDNFRDYVPTLLKRKAQDKDLCKNSSCDDKRIKNNFEIPVEMQDFFINLGCQNNTSISAAIFRYIIIPELMKKVK